MAHVTWHLDNLKSIDGNTVRPVGAPRIIETVRGGALEFDGLGDGIFFDTNPLAGLREFTVEVDFQPYPNGAIEQRFFHMQEGSDDNRVLFETRLTDDDQWYLDAFIQTASGGYMLKDEQYKRPIGPWYQAAIVVGGGKMHYYINRELEMSRTIEYEPLGAGKTSLGVRLNNLHWYKGAIRKVRFTPGALASEDLLTA